MLRAYTKALDHSGPQLPGDLGSPFGVERAKALTRSPRPIYRSPPYFPIRCNHLGLAARLHYPRNDFPAFGITTGNRKA